MPHVLWLAIDSGITAIVYCNTEAACLNITVDLMIRYFGIRLKQFLRLNHYLSITLVDGNSIVVLPEDGDPLDVILRNFYGINGVEPMGLHFEPTIEHIVLSLYDYAYGVALGRCRCAQKC